MLCDILSNRGTHIRRAWEGNNGTVCVCVSDWLARLASQEPGQSAGTLTGNMQLYICCAGPL